MTFPNSDPSHWAVTRAHQHSTGTAYSTTNAVNFKTVAAAAKGRWLSILTYFGIADEFLRKRHGPCPACGGKDRFRFDNKNGSGSYFCNQCSHGDGFQLLQMVNGYSASEALHLVAGFIGEERPDAAISFRTTAKNQPVEADSAPVGDSAVIKTNEKLWSASRTIISGDAVDLYLRHTRGLQLEQIPHALRFHPSVPYFDEQQNLVGYYSAMLAQVVGFSGQVVAIHKTYLNDDGTKADLQQIKKLSRVIYSGATQGAAIRLWSAAGDTLLVAEGIETALAAHILSGTKLPAWATVTANGLESFQLPEGVTKLIIAADNDVSGRGQQAAIRLAERQTRAGVSCQILIPDAVGSDWADVAFVEV